MKIAFSGASGTGKTSLAKFLVEAKALPMCPIGARTVAKELGLCEPDGQVNPYLADYVDEAIYNDCIARGLLPATAVRESLLGVNLGGSSIRATYQHLLQHKKLEWEQDRGNFVSDRSIVDDFTYLALHSVDAVTEDYMRRARWWASNYDLVFFLPMDVYCALGRDKVRAQSMEYHKVYETLLRGMLDQWVPVVVEIPVRALTARKALVLETIERLNH